LTSCELCGRLAGVSTCEPLLVSGEVIGSVLVAHSTPPDALSRQRIRETVSQAAPVLGNLRNLAIAELRASTDRLTGLPNQRAVQDTLKRMVAQASRTITPLTAVLLDLDHFKQINDVYGHDSGDEVLAAVGVAMRLAMRESDFVGRYGGEEFLMLLPSTDTDGAIQVTEAVRAAIGAIRVPTVDRQVTASAGIATLPRDAGDSVTLFRAADRALYAAKNAGRNRIHTATDQLRSDALVSTASGYEGD
jgi:diguanylate cyclase (GGDEF)-like protein